MDNCTEFLSSLSDNMTASEIWASLLQEERRDIIAKIPAFIYMSLLIALGVPGNIIVLLVYRTRFRPSTTKCFIVAMAAFDLCSCVFAMPFEIVDIRYDIQLDIPALCKIMRFLLALFTYGSVMVLVGVAVDRFRRVCRPYSHQMTVKNSKKGIVAIALIAAVFSIPNLVFYGRNTVQVKGFSLVDCSIDDAYVHSIWPKLYFIFQGISWFLAIVILSVMYGFIIFNIKKANKRRQRLDSSTVSNNTINIIGVNNGPLPKELSTKQATRKNKASTPAKSKPSSSNSLDGVARQSSRNDKDLSHSQTLPIITTDNVDSRASNRKGNSLTRLFSRDVNPVADQQDGLQRGSSRESSGLETLSEQCQETAPQSGLQGVLEHEEGFYLGDGVSSQNLIADGTKDEVPLEGPHGEDNAAVDVDLGSSRCVLHTSSSEGYCLEQCHELNSYHKILSQSRQGLNALGASTAADVLLNSPHTKKHNSMENLSRAPEGNQPDQQIYESNQRQPDSGDSNAFRRTKSFPVRQHSHTKISETSMNSGSYKPESICSIPVDKTVNMTNAEKDDDAQSKTTTLNEIGEIVNIPNSTSNSNANKPNRGSNSQGEQRNSLPQTEISANGRQSTQNEIKRVPSVRKYSSSHPPPPRHSRTSLQRQISICSNDDYGNSSSKKSLYQRKQSTMKELKTSKLAMMMFHVTLGFVLSYLPHLSIQIAKILQPETMAREMCDSTFVGFYHVALRSVFLNHTLNPLIYGYYNKRFRQYCSGLLRSPFRFLRKSGPVSSDKTHSFSMEQA